MKNLLVFVGFLLCVHPLFAQESIINLPGNIKMVLVPDGEFIMGSDGPRHLEMPSHKVKVDGFYIDATEVTQEEFKSLMGRNPAFHNDDPKYTKEPQDNPTGPEAWGIEKVLRGGSYKQHDNKFEDLVTSSSRGMTYPYAAHPTDGFRCVRPVK